jgi:heme/copper-type cytochrome/quinol oxidase subunit 3
MTGLRASVTVCAVTFLLGLLFLRLQIHSYSLLVSRTGALCALWTADAITLWQSPLTNEHLASAGGFYAVLAKMPTWLTRTFVGVVVLGGTTLLWSLGDGRAGNIMFDGASACEYSPTMFSRCADPLSVIVLYATAIWVYLSSAVPGMFSFFVYHYFSSLLLELTAHFGPMPVPSLSTIQEGKFPAALREPTLALASAHIIVSLALTGVLILQAGRWWAEQKDVNEGEMPGGTEALANTS